MIGRFTQFGLTVIGLLLLISLCGHLGTAAGRGFLWDRAMSLLSSPDTYIALLVILVNSLVYSLIIKGLYPTSRATLRGLSQAVMLVKGDEFRDSQGGEIGHFFMIFLFPFLVLAAGIAEYQWLKAWLLPQ
jgi:hypothetical protein